MEQIDFNSFAVCARNELLRRRSAGCDKAERCRVVYCNLCAVPEESQANEVLAG